MEDAAMIAVWCCQRPDGEGTSFGQWNRTGEMGRSRNENSGGSGGLAPSEEPQGVQDDDDGAPLVQDHGDTQWNDAKPGGDQEQGQH